ncbi:hypothetical protein ACFY3N_35105 [Streptomyces sp. NPDC000348]|uniref:hypothetical protein n=1 Tax=Streptomyces sp. NPDC000348 TaxID=3364538 RepID=UPI0036B58B94
MLSCASVIIGAFGRPAGQQSWNVSLDRAAGPGLAVWIGMLWGGRPGLGEMALSDSGSPEQQGDGLEPVWGGDAVVDCEGRDQGEAVSGGRLAGVLVKDLVAEVAEEAPVVPVGVDLGVEQHRGLGRPRARQTVGDDVPEQLPDRRTSSVRGVPGLLGFGVRVHGQRSLLERLEPTARRPDGAGSRP